MIILVIGLLGLLLGSFVNAFVWRLHEQEQLKHKKTKKAQQRLKDLSITKGRSMCVDCGHELAPQDLLPVFSWLYLKGKCRYCHKTISWQYPLVEIVTAALFVISYVSWPIGFQELGLFQFIVWLIFVVMFVALAVYDIRWFLLPDRVVLPLIVLAIFEVVTIAIGTRSLAALYLPFLGALVIFGLFFGLFQYSKGEWIGGGDVKIAPLLGLLAASPLKGFMVIFFASLIGTLIALPMLIKSKNAITSKIPFGPHLLSATFIVVLYGDKIIHLYQRLLLN
jgi:prepilin signal peptidase PulO-like enzyme (type II secretory pathway)